jgi:MFS family permease
MTVEHAPRNRRGFYGSWPQMGVYAGIVLANLVLGGFLLLPEDQFRSWGWRVPFLLGSVLVVLGLYLRRSITESPEFTKSLAGARRPVRVPIVEALRTGRRAIAVTFGAKAAETCTFYLITVFALILASDRSGVGQRGALNGVLVASLISVVTVGAFGALADRLGRRPLYLFGAAFMVVFAFPFCWLANSGSTVGLWLALIIGLAVGHASMYGAQSSYFSELFDAQVRYSGASLGYQLGAALIGGFTPLIAAALLLRSNGAQWPIALYIVVLCLASVVVIAVWGQVRPSPAISAEPAQAASLDLSTAKETPR